MIISDTDAVYLYGLDIIAEQLAQSDRYYYVHDGLGSVRQVLDSTAQIATRYTYDSFGVPLAGNGVPNPWRFTGEAWDAQVELLYLRARYYQPETGRFITSDPWPGDPLRPSTLNWYLYVFNNATNYADPGGLDFTGPGPACRDCGQMSQIAASDPVAWEELVELALILWLPHDTKLTWDPRVVREEWLRYSQTGYPPRGSLGLAELLVYSWLLPLPKEDYWFGPKHSLTQDVRYDSGLRLWFRSKWAQTDPPYKVPFSLRHERDPRSGTWQAQLIGWMTLAQENTELAMCVLGRGSETAEEPIDPVGGIVGSLDMIEVKPAGIGTVRFEVHNRMDRASLSRLPGMPRSIIDPVERNLSNVLRGHWWGTTVRHHFYWYEPHPLGAMMNRNY